MTDQNIYFIGCDPGQSGGFVILDESMNVKEVFKTPQDRVSFIDKMNEVSSIGKVFLMKERVHSQPKNGGKSNFTFGYNIGILEACITMAKIPFQDITPQTWMKFFMLKKEKNEAQTAWKNRIKQRAQELFPSERVTLWNADAFMIAEYCRRTMSRK
jgi:hypothetical protein